MVERTRSRQLAGLAGWLVVSLAAGALGGLASVNAAEFYGALSQPSWAPPSSVFGPVWTALYIMIGIAAWLVWRERGFAGARAALVLFAVQLAANALWTWLFFAWREGGLAFAEILLLWALIAITIVLFWRVRALAGALMLPYLLWVSFASALTYAIWQRNPSVL
jgi:tryptophan-rich sensory protein